MSQANSPVERKLIRCFQDIFGAKLPADVTQANVDNTPTWDSMTTWTLVLLVQERFGVTIGLDQIPKLTSFSSLRDYVEKKMAAKS